MSKKEKLRNLLIKANPLMRRQDKEEKCPDCGSLYSEVRRGVDVPGRPDLGKVCSNSWHDYLNNADIGVRCRHNNGKSPRQGTLHNICVFVWKAACEWMGGK